MTHGNVNEGTNHRVGDGGEVLSMTLYGNHASSQIKWALAAHLE